MKARVVWLVLCAIWGSTWLFIKIGLEDLPPISFAGLRFVLASLILVALATARGSRFPRRSDWTLLLVAGVLGFACNYGLLFWGEQHVSSGLAALLQATIPAFGLVFAHLVLPGERMTPLKVSGVVLGVFGVGVIFSNQFEVADPLALRGSLAIVAGGICIAYANVLVKARGGHLDAAVLSAGQMIFGLLPLVVIGWAVEGSPFAFHWTLRAVVSLLYLTVVGLFGLGLGAIVRNTAGGIATFAGLMFVLPPLMNVLPTSWNNAASPYLPLQAGEAIMSTAPGNHLAPWTGLGLLCGYTAVAFALAAVLLVHRDT